MFQQSLQKGPASEASLHMLTFYHQHNGSILLMWGRKTGTGLGLPSMTCGGLCSSLGEALERSTVAPPMWGQIDLSYQKPVLSRVFHESSRWNTFAGTLLQKHQRKTVIVCKWQKTLKWPWLKVWGEFVIMQLTRMFVYFCDIHFKIMADNVIPGHIRFLGISYKYTVKKV